MREIAISDVEFGQFRELMRRVAGVDLPESRRHLVSGRLSRRLRATGLASYGAYYQLVCGGSAPDEYQRMLDLLTTHETYFFRESRYLEHLAGAVLESLARVRAPRVWSAACSSGEEAYSIAMVLMDRLGAASPWEVFGSDISRVVLVRHDPLEADAPLIVYLGADRLGEARPLFPIDNDRASTKPRPVGWWTAHPWASPSLMPAAAPVARPKRQP